MKRKQFISSIALSAASMAFSKGLHAADAPAKSVKIPHYLVKGDIIGITAPAGYITIEQVMPSVRVLESWGYKVRLGSTIGKRSYSFAGNDDERLLDFQQMLDDHDVKAIMCARGGYGAVRIADRLDFSHYRKHPKWIIGFSDVTVLLSHVFANFRVAGIHSKMCNSFPDVWEDADEMQKETIISINSCLSGNPMQYVTSPDAFDKAGSGMGSLVGGNLKMLESLSGTPSGLNTDNCILFLEDTGEYLYSIDRMFWNLKRSGRLDHLQGLIIGGFKVKADDPGEEFGRNLYEIIMEKVKDCRYPVCFGFPVGHQKNNFALKYGVSHRLEVNDKGARLTEHT